MPTWFCALENFPLPWWERTLPSPCFASGSSHCQWKREPEQWSGKSPLLLDFFSLLFLEGGKDTKWANTQVKGHPYCLSYWHLPWWLGSCGDLRTRHHEVMLPLVDITRLVPSACAQLPPSLQHLVLPLGRHGLSDDGLQSSASPSCPWNSRFLGSPSSFSTPSSKLEIFFRRGWSEWIAWCPFATGISAG